MGKKIFRGEAEDFKDYWWTQLSKIDDEHSMADAVDVHCQKIVPQGGTKKSLREVLKDQKRGALPRIGASQTTYDLDVTGDVEGTVRRKYNGNIAGPPGRQFILIDNGDYFTAYPVNHVVNFVLQLTEEGINGRALPPIMQAACDGNMAGLEKEAEKFRLKEHKLEKEAIRLRNTSTTATIAAGHTVDHAEEKPAAPGPVDAGGKKKKKKKGMREMDDWGASALNVGAVRKAEHDWDFDGDEEATDDEGALGQEDEEETLRVDVDQFVGADVSDSSAKDSDEELDATGQNIKDAMSQAELRAADAELDQFSDDSDEEGAAKPQEAVQQQAPQAAGRPMPIQTQTAEDPLKSRIIGSLQRRGNAMSTKEFMAKFVKTKEKTDPTFVAVRKWINTLCEVINKKDPTTGNMTRYIQLKQDYRN